MKRIDSIEQALQQAEKLQFVMVTELSRVVIGKMPMDINWDELIEARFFDHDTEIRIFRENGELRVRSVILQDDMPYIEKQYNKLQGNLGSEISVREYLTFDEVRALDNRTVSHGKIKDRSTRKTQKAN